MKPLAQIFAEEGYKEATSYATYFDNADIYGATAIKRTYKHCLKDADNDYVSLMELAKVLHYKKRLHHVESTDVFKVYAELRSQFLANYLKSGD